MDLHQDLDLRSDRFAYGADPLDGHVLLSATNVCAPWVREWVEFECGKTAANGFFGSLRELIRGFRLV